MIIITANMALAPNSLKNLKQFKKLQKDSNNDLLISASTQAKIAEHCALNFFRKYLASKDFIKDFNRLRRVNPNQAILIALERGIGKVQLDDSNKATVTINIQSDVFKETIEVTQTAEKSDDIENET